MGASALDLGCGVRTAKVNVQSCGCVALTNPPATHDQVQCELAIQRYRPSNKHFSVKRNSPPLAGTLSRQLEDRQEVTVTISDILEAKVERGKLTYTPTSVLDRVPAK